MRIAVLIVTGYRPGKDYLNQTVQSLKESGFWNRDQTLPLQIIVNWLSPEFLDQWKLRGQPWIRVTTLSQAQAQGFDWIKMNPPRRCCVGHYLAIRHAAMDPVVSQADYFLICEDDIVMARNWHAVVRSIVPEIEAQHRKQWVLTLYRCNLSGMLDRMRRGERWFQEGETYLLGSQAVLYPKQMLRHIAPVMLEDGARRDEVHADQAIARACQKSAAPILFTVPCLAQHQGKTSMHTSGFFHQAEVFHRNVPRDVPKNCPQCGVNPGARHREDCTLERCSECGQPRVLCKDRHFDHDPSFSRWTGFPPGELEARGLGLAGPNDLGFDDLYKLFYVKPKA
jgi:hypothetical protein